MSLPHARRTAVHFFGHENASMETLEVCRACKSPQLPASRAALLAAGPVQHACAPKMPPAAVTPRQSALTYSTC